MIRKENVLAIFSVGKCAHELENILSNFVSASVLKINYKDIYSYFSLANVLKNFYRDISPKILVWPVCPRLIRYLFILQFVIGHCA